MDYNAIAQKYGALKSTSPSSAGSNVDYSALAQKFGAVNSTPAPTDQTQPSTDSGGGIGDTLANFAKGLVKAPATILARPVQAIEGAGQYIFDRPQIDNTKDQYAALQKQSDDLYHEIVAARTSGADTTDVKARIAQNAKDIAALGAQSSDVLNKRPSLFQGSSIVAPVPESAGDVEKDVGRGIQTVALGLGPIAGGAAFGAGNSLEQGNNLLSAQTAFQAVLGAGAGKVLDLVGKPLLDAAGKVIGKITPQTIQDVAAGGAKAITDFAAQHELPLVGKGGAIRDFTAPIENKIEAGVNAVENAPGKLFQGAKDTARKVISSQYPALSTESLQNHFLDVERSNFAKPAEQTKGFTKASDIFDNAQKQGNDLADEAVKLGVRHDDLIDGKVYNTSDTADKIRQDAMKTSHDLMRPALAAAEPGIERVPLSDIREKMLAQADNIPASKITPEERAVMKRRINNEYSDTSAAAKAHPEGYNLTDLHDSTIAKQANGKFSPTGTPTQNFPARIAREQAKVFDSFLTQNAPENLGVKNFKSEIQKKFQLADYLDQLHGKKVPEGVVQKAAKFFGNVLGSAAGSTVGGGIGGIAGYHLGGSLFNSFDNLENPVKAYYLKSIEKSDPEIFAAFKKYIGDKETESLLRLKLPAPGETAAVKDPGSIFYVTPKGKASPDLQDAFSVGDSERLKAPKGGLKGRANQRQLKDLYDNTIPLTAQKDLPVIKVPKRIPRTPGKFDHLPVIRYDN